METFQCLIENEVIYIEALWQKMLTIFIKIIEIFCNFANEWVKTGHARRIP